MSHTIFSPTSPTGPRSRAPRPGRPSAASRTTRRASATRGAEPDRHTTVTIRRGSPTERFTSIVETMRGSGRRPAALVRDERRVAERHLGDDSRLVAHGDAVAEADGLSDREQQARAEVAERRREGDSGDHGEDRARREECLRDLLRRREDREHAPEPDQDDQRDHDAEEEAERRPAARGDSGILLRELALVAVERERRTRSARRAPRRSRRRRERGPERPCVHAGHSAPTRAEPARAYEPERTWRLGGRVLLVRQRAARVERRERREPVDTSASPQPRRAQLLRSRRRLCSSPACAPTTR